MKSHMKLSALLLMFCCLYSGSNWAWGHHGGGHFGFYFGAPFYPYYGYGYGFPAYPYPYYPPAVVTVPAAPQTYIQQAPAVQQAAPQNQSNFWHYCNNPEGYYPYVKECPSGWQLVEPTPR